MHGFEVSLMYRRAVQRKGRLATCVLWDEDLRALHEDGQPVLMVRPQRQVLEQLYHLRKEQFNHDYIMIHVSVCTAIFPETTFHALGHKPLL